MKKNNIDKSYSDFYGKNSHISRVYPTEFVVRTFMASYPGLSFSPPEAGRVLDNGCGDGRNLAFLLEQGYDAYGTEITSDIIELVENRLESLGLKPGGLKVGRNGNLPFEDEFFDVLLGCHVSYYCDKDKNFRTNVKDFARILRKNGWFVSSFISTETYMLKDCEKVDFEPGHYIVKNDPYQNRNGSKFRAFSSFAEIETELESEFYNFSFGKAFNNYYGIDERVFWVVCQKK